MKGYNTSIVLLLEAVLFLAILTSCCVQGRERTYGYEAYRNRQQRLQMEREAQQKRLEEKNSEFVKGKSKCVQWRLGVVPDGLMENELF